MLRCCEPIGRAEDTGITLHGAAVGAQKIRVSSHAQARESKWNSNSRAESDGLQDQIVRDSPIRTAQGQWQPAAPALPPTFELSAERG
jgi:hypothetical protein